MSDEPRVVLITGASSGIGRATALECVRRGDRVALNARSREGLETVADECRRMGGEVLVVPADVTTRTAIEDLFDTVTLQWGRVDVVVHAAAVIAYGRFTDVPADVYDSVLETNIVGTTNVARSALAHFEAQGAGHLVLVGSLLGNVSVPLMSSYVTTKWAVHGLARALQIEARSQSGIEVSLVSPGGVDTPIYKRAANYVGRVPTAPPPVVSPEKVARAIVRVMDHPNRERKVGLANQVIELGFRTMPAVFDLAVTPMMKLLALTREEASTTTGNVVTPSEEPVLTH